MIQLILTLTLTPKPILIKSNLNNNVPTNVCNFECHGQKNKFVFPKAILRFYSYSPDILMSY